MVENLLGRNRKYASGEIFQHNLVQQRKNTLHGQKPHTIVICCSDSRVCPEFIFNCGIGEIFVLRTAGNIIDQLVMKNIEFALNNLPIRQIIIMGHTNCGAIKTLYRNNQHRLKFLTIGFEFQKSIEEGKRLFDTNEELAIMFLITENLEIQLSKLSRNPTIEEKLQDSQLVTLSGIYNLETGLFETIELM